MKNGKRSDYLRAASLGLEFAVSVFLGAFLGYWADGHFGSAPWGLIVGLIIGSVAAFWNAYRVAASEDNGNS